MGALFEVGPLGGVLGASTCSIFKLDPLTWSIPLEPLLDLVPGGILTPLRVTLDMVDDERIIHEYAVTQNSLQDAGDAASNVHKKLDKLTVQGTLSTQISLTTPISDLDLFVPIPNPGGIFRFDLIKIQNLKLIADAREPVMVVTPRYSLARALIERIDRPWKPSNGESSEVSISFQEMRIVTASIGAALSQDFKAQAPGNNVAVGGGEQFTSAAAGQGPGAPASGAGLAPTPMPGN